MSGPLRTESLRDGQIEHIVLDRPKANVLDAETIAAIRAHLATLTSRAELKLLIFEGEGRHFSFGASVAEHLPGQFEKMIPSFHDLFRELEALGVPTAAVVRGQCLGGGFELATYCGWVFCDESARFGVPEVTLAVFPPIAAMMLHERVRGPLATDLIVTGRMISGDQAVGVGLAEACAANPTAALQDWFDHNLAEKSAVGIRYAWRAARRHIARALEVDLPVLEELYIADLMSRNDPVEGLNAFLERRKPLWSHT